MSDTQPIEGQEQPTAEAEPPRPRAGLFGPPGRDYECANCDGQLCGWCEREAQP